MAKHFLLIIFVLLQVICFSQKTRITGSISDKESGELLPFVNVSFKGSKVGTASDIHGNYLLESIEATDTIIASFIGYKPNVIPIQRNIAQQINIILEPQLVSLKTVEISGSKKDVNPAEVLMKKVIENKSHNNRKKLDAYEYEVYNKVQFDLTNFSEKIKENRFLEPFEFAFDNTESEDGNSQLPMFFTESVSDFYYKKPGAEKEVIKAVKVSGIKNESINQFMGDMYQKINLYENYIPFFRKSFVSPIADFGKISYKYYLTDSAQIKGHKCFKIEFFPKRKGELTFIGSMWIADTSYAVKRFEAGISEDANINFINNLQIRQEYDEVENEKWMLVRDQLSIDFNISQKTIGIFGKKTASYKWFNINKPKPSDFFNPNEHIVVLENAQNKDDSYWNDHRHIKLSNKENGIYNMVDSIKKVPRFNTYYDLVSLLISGYWIKGNFELGKYYTFYSFNPIEGNRFKFGGRTSNQFSKKVMPEAYIAYGTKDQKFKYGGGFLYMFSKKPRQTLSAYYKNDVEQLGLSQNAWRTDNIIASVFQRNPFNRMNGIEEYKINYEKEWFQGFSNTLQFRHYNLWSITDKLIFQRPLITPESRNYNKLYFSEISITSRFAYQEKFLLGAFERVSLGSPYPITTIQYTHGLKGVIHSQFKYQKLQINITDKIRINPIGVTDININVGAIWGNAPYPVLELHTGNQTLAYDPLAYNLMNLYEFVSDKYASVFITHHFNGIFLNKIPLMNRLKWREVLSAKAVTGSLRNSNRNILEFPNTLNSLSKPYVEAGVGIENIFKVMRIDALWRLSHLKNPNIAKFGIRTRFQVNF